MRYPHDIILCIATPISLCYILLMDRFDEMYDPEVHRVTPKKKRHNPLDDFSDIGVEEQTDDEAFINKKVSCEKQHSKRIRRK